MVHSSPRADCENLVTGAESAEVNIETDPVAETEFVQDTDTDGPLVLNLAVVTIENLVVRALETKPASGSIRNDIPETGLLVAAESVGDVPEEICMCIVHCIPVTCTIVDHGGVTRLYLEGVVDAPITDPGTNARSEPLAEVCLNCKTAESPLDIRS